jgi:hypothetical protein
VLGFHGMHMEGEKRNEEKTWNEMSWQRIGNSENKFVNNNPKVGTYLCTVHERAAEAATKPSPVKSYGYLRVVGSRYL